MLSQECVEPQNECESAPHALPHPFLELCDCCPRRPGCDTEGFSTLLATYLTSGILGGMPRLLVDYCNIFYT